MPVLGICLGHQGICHVLGGGVERAPVPMHGRLSDIHHAGSGLFQGLPSPFRAVRYHSLVAVPPLPAGLRVTAWTEDGLIMAVEHETRPLWGVQFHPESILSEHGHALLRNFRDLTERYAADSSARHAKGKPDCGEGDAAQGGGSGGVAAAIPAHRRRGRSGRSVQAAVRRFSPTPSGSTAPLCRRAVSPTWETTAGRTQSVLSHRSDTAAGPDDDILTFVQRRLAGIDIDAQQAPFPFKGGFVGYLGYELRTGDGWRATHSSPHPDAQLIFPGRFLCFDHGEGAVYAVTVAPEGGDQELDWLDRCAAVLERLEPDGTPAEERDAAGAACRFLAPFHPGLSPADRILPGGNPRRRNLRGLPDQPALPAAAGRSARDLSAAAPAQPRSPCGLSALRGSERPLLLAGTVPPHRCRRHRADEADQGHPAARERRRRRTSGCAPPWRATRRTGRRT